MAKAEWVDPVPVVEKEILLRLSRREAEVLKFVIGHINPVKYDKEADALYVQIIDAKVDKTVALDDQRNIDYTADGGVVGVEFLDASFGVSLRDLPFSPTIDRLIKVVMQGLRGDGGVPRSRFLARSKHMGIDAEMFVRTKEAVTPEMVRQWAYEAGERFGPDRFWIFESDSLGAGQSAMELISVYEQDGPDIEPEDGETFIQVHPATRYYGQGYERGDFAFLYMLSKWLEIRIPGAEVWYGGDSSGTCAEKFSSEERERMFRYWVEVGCEPYQRGFGCWDMNTAPSCPRCFVKMTNSGGGQSRSFYSCHGCGKRAIVSGLDVQWLKREEKFV